jgi:outer membrane biosynthesis protein TonB
LGREETMGVQLNVQMFRGGQLVGQQSFDSDVTRTVKIGKLASAQVKLDDPKASRIHAVIEFAGNDASLIDMGSTEGTSVNGAKVHKTKINSGDKITICDTLLVVTTGAAAASAAAGAPAPAAAPMGPPPGAMPGFAMPGGRPAAAPAFAGYGMPAAAPGAMPGMQAPAAWGAPPMGGAPMAAPMMHAGAPGAAPAAVGQTPRFDPGSQPEGAPLRRISQQRLRSAAVESKPHPALPPEQQITTDNRILEMRLYWGEVMLGINHYDKPRRITIGETKRTDVFISSEGLPVEEYPIVRFIDGEYVLNFTTHMEGELEVAGQSQTLQSVRGSSLAKRDDSMAESYQVRLPLDARAIIHWGGATVALRFVPPAELPPSSFWKNVDLQFLNVAVMSLFFHLSVMVTLNVYPYDTEALREDLFDKPDRFTNLILEPPKTSESNKDLLEKIKKEVEQKKEEIVKKDKEEQKVEQKVQPKPDITKIATKIPPAVKPQKTQEQRAAEVKQKFSSLFSGGGGGSGSGSLLGGGGGGSLSGTLSGVIGTAGSGSTFDGAGIAGLGIRGSGPLTGGGVGTSRGIAGIGTSGRLGGGGLAYGSNVGLGAHRNTNMTDIGTPIIQGALPPEVIKKVIDENKNQIRYCYEVELQRNQNLEGRVNMTWIIGATGAVASVKVKESTINSPNVERCISAKIMGWKFPAPAGGGVVQVNYPFIFKAS